MSKLDSRRPSALGTALWLTASARVPKHSPQIASDFSCLSRPPEWWMWSPHRKRY